MNIRIFTTGGTLDKIYFDSKDKFSVGDTIVGSIMNEAQVNFEFEITSLMQKDSLEMTDLDRIKIREAIISCPEEKIIVTHGTDTMAETAKKLIGIANKTVALTGALVPARFRSSDANFNIGMAVAAVQCMPAGIYVAMNGQVFPGDSVHKDLKKNRFLPDTT